MNLLAIVPVVGVFSLSTPPAIVWRHSVAVGRPDAGQLVRAVRLPARGAAFATWDPALKRSPNRWSRRNGTDRLVRVLLRAVRAPRLVSQVDRRLAQDLVDRFVRAGAQKVFFGPSVGLHGPRAVVEVLAHHDDHLHVRLPAISSRRSAS